MKTHLKELALLLPLAGCLPYGGAYSTAAQYQGPGPCSTLGNLSPECRQWVAVGDDAYCRNQFGPTLSSPACREWSNAKTDIDNRDQVLASASPVIRGESGSGMLTQEQQQQEQQREVAARSSEAPVYTTEQVCPLSIMGGDFLITETLNGCVAKQQSSLYIVRDVWPRLSVAVRKDCLWSIASVNGIHAYSYLADCLLVRGRSELILQMPDRLDYR